MTYYVTLSTDMFKSDFNGENATTVLVFLQYSSRIYFSLS